MRYKEIDINIKAIPDKEDEALLNQLMGAKKATVTTDTDEKPIDDTNADNPGKVASDDPTTVPSVYPLQQELELKKQDDAMKDLEDSKADIGWGSQIRSYVLDSARIKDLRTGIETSNCSDILDGNLDVFIEESLKMGIK